MVGGGTSRFLLVIYLDRETNAVGLTTVPTPTFVSRPLKDAHGYHGNRYSPEGIGARPPAVMVLGDDFCEHARFA